MAETDSSYIFYADESGDHSLTSIDENFPVFALSLCGFKKSSYCSQIVPRFQQIKFHYFGHDAVILHEHEIRKQKGDFRLFAEQRLRESFVRDVSECLEASPFRMAGCVILKSELKLDFFPDNPYAIALGVCLVKVYQFLRAKNEAGKRTFFIFEKRGAREDQELELAFRRIIAADNQIRTPMPGFEAIFLDKKSNSIGLQIADLTARPMALSVFRKDQPNRAFDILSAKLIGRAPLSAKGRGIFA